MCYGILIHPDIALIDIKSGMKVTQPLGHTSNHVTCLDPVDNMGPQVILQRAQGVITSDKVELEGRSAGYCMRLCHSICMVLQDVLMASGVQRRDVTFVLPPLETRGEEREKKRGGGERRKRREEERGGGRRRGGRGEGRGEEKREEGGGGRRGRRRWEEEEEE